MTDPLFDTNDGATPLDDDEAVGLRPTWIRTRGDLNQAEAHNILQSRQSIRIPSIEVLLDDLWLRKLHKRMFGEVWTWAGKYRLSNRNIGVDWTEVPVAVRSLLDDCLLWVNSDASEAAIARLHHRLVAIHPFPNGNGRHSRAVADYLSAALNTPAPTWGSGNFTTVDELRATYLAALRALDRDPDDLTALIDFMWPAP